MLDYKKFRYSTVALVSLLLGASGLPLFATSVTLDFEGLADGTPFIAQYPALTFTNTTVVSAGISLNEFEFPPHSGTNGAFDDGGPISIVFASPIQSFSGYFTYAEPLTIVGFNSSNVQVSSTNSAFSNNEALSGDPGSSPNEFIELSLALGISSISISGDPAGGSFVMDDLRFTSTNIPEPADFGILLAGLALLFMFRKIQI